MKLKQNYIRKFLCVIGMLSLMVACSEDPTPNLDDQTNDDQIQAYTKYGSMKLSSIVLSKMQKFGSTWKAKKLLLTGNKTNLKYMYYEKTNSYYDCNQDALHS